MGVCISSWDPNVTNGSLALMSLIAQMPWLVDISAWILESWTASQAWDFLFERCTVSNGDFFLMAPYE